MWLVDAGDGVVWGELGGEGQAPGLIVRVRFAPTGDGVAVAGVQVERTDGRAVTARDLRAVKLPPNWVLFGEAAARWFQPSGEPVRASRKGPNAKSDEHWHAVWNAWQQAQQAAPRAPVAWLLTRWPVSDATMRRWVRQARERAAARGWPDAAPPQEARGFPQYGSQPPAPEHPPDTDDPA